VNTKTIVPLVLAAVFAYSSSSYGDLTITVTPAVSSSQSQLSMIGSVSVSPSSTCVAGPVLESVGFNGKGLMLEADAMFMTNIDSAFACLGQPNQSMVTLTTAIEHDFFRDGVNVFDATPLLGSTTVPWMLSTRSGQSLFFEAFDPDGHNNPTIPTPSSISWNVSTTVDIAFQDFNPGSYAWGNTADVVVGNGVTLHVVPEPSAFLYGGLIIVLVGAINWRKRLG